MDAIPKKKQKPEERELEEKLFEVASLEAELTQRELDLTTLQAELNVFQEEYLRIVGARYAKLDEIKAQRKIWGSTGWGRTICMGNSRNFQ